jgi:DNA-binding Xre family transcriptional regulator/uncharacterized small protein (DUF1192 family)
MAQTAALLNTLKRRLKAQGKTYADVASVLELSEASVKRLFSEQSFSLERLDAVCRMLDMEISDLVAEMQAGQQRIDHLSIEQERMITEDLVLLLVTVCVLNHWTVEDITRHYALSTETCVGKLLALDRLQVIDLLPGDRVKLRVSQNFSWLSNGPIQRFFQEKIGREYFDTGFQGENECLRVLNGMLSAASCRELQRRIARLANEFDELNTTDISLPFDDRHGVTVVLAMRNWEYGLFRHMLRI